MQILITINGKTYKVERPEKSSITIEALISAWIKSGVLEEVKENKELSQLQTFPSPDKFKAMREQPQFTQGQEIEVSNDGEKWEKRDFQNMIEDKFQCWQNEDEHEKSKLYLKSWKYARPIEDKIEAPKVELPELPDFKATFYPMQDNQCGRQVEALTKGYNAITSYLRTRDNLK